MTSIKLCWQTQCQNCEHKRRCTRHILKSCQSENNEQRLRWQQHLTMLTAENQLPRCILHWTSKQSFECSVHIISAWKSLCEGHNCSKIRTLGYCWYDAKNCWIRSPSRFSWSALRRMFSKHCWTVRAAAAAGCSLKNSCTQQVSTSYGFISQMPNQCLTRFQHKQIISCP